MKRKEHNEFIDYVLSHELDDVISMFNDMCFSEDDTDNILEILYESISGDIDIEVFKFLHNAFCDIIDVSNIIEEYSDLFDAAVYANRIDIIEFLLKHDNFDKLYQVEYAYIFINAITHNNIEAVKLFLEDGRINPAMSDNYPIRSATHDDLYDIIKLLMEDERVDPSDFNNDALYTAVSHESYDIVKLLMTDKRVLYKINLNIIYCDVVYNEFKKITCCKSFEEVKYYLKLL